MAERWCPYRKGWIMPIKNFSLELVPDSNGGLVAICELDGGGCVVITRAAYERENQGARKDVDYFVSPDAHLAQLTEGINDLFRKTQENRSDKNSKLGIIYTPRGWMPIWKYENSDNAPHHRTEQRIPYDSLSSEEKEKLFWLGKPE
jgi:ribosomal protein S15P/S13E